MPIPTTMPAFVTAPRSVNQPDNSKGRPNRQKIGKDKAQWDLIPITYTKLLPKLIEGGLVVPVHSLPLKPPFPKQYNANAHCDYHSRISSHSMENCIVFKNEVQRLVRAEKLRFENRDQSNEVGDLLPNLSQHPDQHLEQMLKDIKEWATKIKEEYEQETLAQREASEGGKAEDNSNMLE